MRFTKSQKTALSQLSSDVDLLNLKGEIAEKFVSNRLGREVKWRTIMKYLKPLQEGEVTNEWLANYKKIGFMVQHHELLDRARSLLADSTTMLEDEKNKHKPNFYKISVLMRIQVDHIKLVEELKVGTPIMAQIKDEKDSYKQRCEDLEKQLSDLQAKNV